MKDDDIVGRAVTKWFEGRYALVTRLQAQNLGLSSAQIDSRLRRGRWHTVHPGVYHLTGAPWDSITALYAAALAAGPDAALSHRSAAWLWGLFETSHELPTVTVPYARCVTIDGVRVVRSRHPVLPVTVRGVPCTDVIRTLLDCATELTATEVDEMVDAALARRILKLDALIGALTKGDLGRMRGRRLVAERMNHRGIFGSPQPSALESRMVRLISRYGLPVPKAEVTWGADGRYRLDFAYPQMQLAIEVDGWASHFSPEQQRHDRRRTNELIQAGWTVLRYGWWEVTREPERVAREIAEAYARLSGES